MRSKFWRVARKTGLIGVLVLGVIYLGLLVWYYRGCPQPTVDFSPELNRVWQSSPATERAWPELREVFAQIQAGDDNLFEDIDILKATPHETKLWELAAKKVRRYREQLERVRTIATRPYFGFPVHAVLSDYADEDFEVLFPDATKESLAYQHQTVAPHPLLIGSISQIPVKHVQHLAILLRIIIIDSYDAAESRDAERITRNLEVGIQLSWYASEADTPFLMSIGIDFRQQVFTCLDWLLNKHPELFGTNHLQRIQIALEHVPDGYSYGVKGEEITYLDMIQRIYTDDGNGDGRITPTGLDLLETICFEGLRMFGDLGQAPRVRTWSFSTIPQLAHRWLIVGLEPIGVSWTESRRAAIDRGQRELQHLRRIVETPWEFPNHFDNFMWRQNEAVNGHSPAINVLRPYPYNSGQIALDKISRNSLVAGLAVMRFHRERGRYPTSWDELVGPYLKAAPIDAWMGGELKLLVHDDSFQIYSIGPDREDNAGRPWVLRSSDNNLPLDSDVQPLPRQRLPRSDEFKLSDSYHNRDIKGDWILFPWH